MKNKSISKMILILIAALGAAMFASACEREDSGAYEQGVSALESGDYDSALGFFKIAAEQDGRYAEAYRGEGLAYLGRGDYSYAVKFFDMSLNAMKHENEEFSGDVLFYKARAQEQVPDPAGAEETYLSLLDGERADEAYALLGNLYLKEDNDSAASAAFENAIALDPSYDNYLIIYEAYDDANREGDGARYLEDALLLTPETPADFMKQGQIYTYLEDYQSARESLNTAIERGNTDAIPILGYICLLQNDIASAKVLYQRVLDAGTNDALAYNGLAMTSLAQGQYEEALSSIRKGLDCNDAEMNKSLLFNQIVVYEKALDFEMAKEKTEEFLKLYPSDDEMRSEYKFLKRNNLVLPL